MEKLKNVHNHTFTDLIKVCIFALMLILPGIMFLPSCLYYGFNEHATNTETTTINYKYESNEVLLSNDLVVGNIYLLEDLYFDDFDAHDISFTLYVVKLENFDFSNVDDSGNDDYLVYNYSNNEYNYIELGLTFQSGDWSINFNLSNLNGYANQYFNGSYGQLHFYNMVFYCDSDSDLDTLTNYLIYTSTINNLPQYTDYNVIESVSVNTDDTISNKLYNSWEQMWNTPLFSWTSNTPFNNSLNGFISIFGINAQSYISNVLIWLLSMTAIYVVIDIVIGVFKWLTHLIGAK